MDRTIQVDIDIHTITKDTITTKTSDHTTDKIRINELEEFDDCETDCSARSDCEDGLDEHEFSNTDSPKN